MPKGPSLLSSRSQNTVNSLTSLVFPFKRYFRYQVNLLHFGIPVKYKRKFDGNFTVSSSILQTSRELFQRRFPACWRMKSMRGACFNSPSHIINFASQYVSVLRGISRALKTPRFPPCSAEQDGENSHGRPTVFSLI